MNLLNTDLSSLSGGETAKPASKATGAIQDEFIISEAGENPQLLTDEASNIENPQLPMDEYLGELDLEALHKIELPPRFYWDDSSKNPTIVFELRPFAKALAAFLASIPILIISYFICIHFPETIFIFIFGYAIVFNVFSLLYVCTHGRNYKFSIVIYPDEFSVSESSAKSREPNVFPRDPNLTTVELNTKEKSNLNILQITDGKDKNFVTTREFNPLDAENLKYVIEAVMEA